MMKPLALALILTMVLGSVVGAGAFELKGYKPGTPIAEIDTKGCEPVADAGSGMTGFRCTTTLGGDPAMVQLTVFEERLAGAVFTVEHGRYRPMLDALTEAYGPPTQSNRYIEEYHWSTPRQSLSIAQNAITKDKYQVVIVDHLLYDRVKAIQKDKAKKDM